LFQSKDDLITKDKWILASKYANTNNEEKKGRTLEYCKKSDEVLVMRFHKDGSVGITEDNGKKFATITWNWKTNEKKYFQLNRGDFYDDFLILKLDGKILQCCKIDINTRDRELMTFRHPEDKKWKDDKTVEILNKMQ
jgi:hypothetical protein